MRLPKPLHLFTSSSTSASARHRSKKPSEARDPAHLDGPACMSVSKQAEVLVGDASSTEALAPALSASSTPPSPEALEKIIRTLDFRLLPWLWLLYAVGFIDRSSIGNAKIAGLPKDLHLQPLQFNVALSVFFASFGFFAVPSNLLLKNCNPAIYVSTLAICWGLVTIVFGAVQNFAGLVAVRMLIGAFEAGLIPACTFLISTWYPRGKLLLRLTIFNTASLFGGAIGGFLARGILMMNGTRHIAGWRWLFILEGTFGVLCGLFVMRFLASTPGRARWLTPSEKTMLVEALGVDKAGESEQFCWSEVAEAFKDWKVWTAAFVDFSLGAGTNSFTLFLPSIINQFGFTANTSQLLVVPPYVTGAIFMVTMGLVSDRYKCRWVPCLASLAAAVLGYLLLVVVPERSVGPRYFALFLVAIGVWSAAVVNMGWLNNNLFGQTKRATGVGIQSTAICLGGVVGSYFYQDWMRPKYALGHGVMMMLVALTAGAVVAQVYVLHWLNKGRTARGEVLFII